ncbi:MAG: hypothetical protein E7066_05100 [Lentimicrobiaceae bacterium]|nr:hypothetical protein [Lentimicrobiaceae bacterium]
MLKMNRIKAFFKLVRWSNLLMIALMMLLVYYCLMSPLSSSGMMGVMPSSPAFMLLVLSILFIVAGGYVINDIFDIDIDKNNKPERLLVTKSFSEKEAKVFYVVLTILGVASALASSLIIAKTKFLTLFALLLLLIGILYSYSSTYKRKLVVGNIIVAISVAFAVFLPWLFEMLYLSNNILLLSASKEVMMGILPYVMIYTAFAFFMTLIREIVKDAEDAAGDSLTHCRTIPIVYGIKKMNIILLVLAVLTWSLLLYFQIILLKTQSYITLGMMFVIWNIIPIMISQLFTKNTTINYHAFSVVLKLLMLLGVLSMLFI